MPTIENLIEQGENTKNKLEINNPLNPLYVYLHENGSLDLIALGKDFPPNKAMLLWFLKNSAEGVGIYELENLDNKAKAHIRANQDFFARAGNESNK